MRTVMMMKETLMLTMTKIQYGCESELSELLQKRQSMTNMLMMRMKGIKKFDKYAGDEEDSDVRFSGILKLRHIRKCGGK